MENGSITADIAKLRAVKRKKSASPPVAVASTFKGFCFATELTLRNEVVHALKGSKMDFVMGRDNVEHNIDGLLRFGRCLNPEQLDNIHICSQVAFLYDPIVFVEAMLDKITLATENTSNNSFDCLVQSMLDLKLNIISRLYDNSTSATALPTTFRIYIIVYNLESTLNNYLTKQNPSTIQISSNIIDDAIITLSYKMDDISIIKCKSIIKAADQLCNLSQLIMKTSNYNPKAMELLDTYKK